MKLTRFAQLPDATLGRLEIAGGPTLFTIERPWQNNEPYVSCVPPGVYPLEWDTTGRIKNTVRLRDTEPRTQINIHAANRAEELHGCIAPGLNWQVNGQEASVTHSKKAMGVLLEILTPDEPVDGLLLPWELEIV